MTVKTALLLAALALAVLPLASCQRATTAELRKWEDEKTGWAAARSERIRIRKAGRQDRADIAVDRMADMEDFKDIPGTNFREPNR